MNKWCAAATIFVFMMIEPAGSLSVSGNHSTDDTSESTSLPVSQWV